MTKAERNDERLVRDPSRIKRIADGSGRSEKDVRGLLNDFNRMKKVAGLMKNDRAFKKNFSKFSGMK